MTLPATQMVIFIVGWKSLYLGWKVRIYRVETQKTNHFLEYHLLERDYTDEVKFYVYNLKYTDSIEVEIIVEFSNDDNTLAI